MLNARLQLLPKLRQGYLICLEQLSALLVKGPDEDCRRCGSVAGARVYFFQCVLHQRRHHLCLVLKLYRTRNGDSVFRQSGLKLARLLQTYRLSVRPKRLLHRRHQPVQLRRNDVLHLALINQR